MAFRNHILVPDRLQQVVFPIDLPHGPAVYLLAAQTVTKFVLLSLSYNAPMVLGRTSSDARPRPRMAFCSGGMAPCVTYAGRHNVTLAKRFYSIPAALSVVLISYYFTNHEQRQAAKFMMQSHD